MRHEIQTRHFPIRLVIDIETEEGLCDLLSRLNAAVSTINDDDHSYKFGANNASYRLWDHLNDLATDLGLQMEGQE